MIFQKEKYIKSGNGLDCYCELITRPEDLYLQGELVGLNPADVTDWVTFAVTMLNDQGGGYYDIREYCDFSIIQAPNGKYYFNIRLNSFPPQMCLLSCFSLWVMVYNIKLKFDGIPLYYINAYTSLYCVPSCCSQPLTLTADVT